MDLNEDTLMQWLFHMEETLFDMRGEISVDQKDVIMKYFQHTGTLLLLSKKEYNRVNKLGPLDAEFGIWSYKLYTDVILHQYCYFFNKQRTLSS